MFLDDFNWYVAYVTHPISELGDIWDCGTKTNEFDVLWCKDNTLFPNCTALYVIDVVDFIKNDIPNIIKPVDIVKDRVPKNFRCHDQYLSVLIQYNITGYNSNLVSILCDQIPIFLVA